MTSKQRFLTALRGGLPDDRIAHMELEFHLFPEMMGEEPVCGEAYAKLSPKERETALHRNAELLVRAAQETKQDAIRDIGGYWEVAPGVGAYLWLPEEEDRLSQLRILKKVAGDEFAIIGTAGGTLCMPDGNEFEHFVIRLFEEPDDLLRECEDNCAWAMEYQKKLIDCGVDAIINCSDIAFNSGPFISPAQLDTFFFPFLSRLSASVKEQGLPYIWHTDGNILPVIDRTLETDVTAIQCVDPLGGMDIVSLLGQVEGNLTLIGNVDCSILHDGPAEAIEEAARSVILGCKRRKGFILSACNVIFKGISVENYRVFLNAIEQYGQLS